MPSQISARALSRIAVCTAMLAIAVLDARATDELLKYPDFSGQWGRDMLFFEPPPSGPGPIVNSVRKADGTMVPLDACCGIVNPWAGDHTNPILKPDAAEAVRKFGTLASYQTDHRQDECEIIEAQIIDKTSARLLRRTFRLRREAGRHSRWLC